MRWCEWIILFFLLLPIHDLTYFGKKLRSYYGMWSDYFVVVCFTAWIIIYSNFIAYLSLAYQISYEHFHCIHQVFVSLHSHGLSNTFHMLGSLTLIFPSLSRFHLFHMFDYQYKYSLSYSISTFLLTCDLKI